MSSQLSTVHDDPVVTQRNRPSLTIFSIISTGCLAILMLGMLAACGGSSTNSSNSGSQTTTITEMDYWTTEPSNTKINELFKQYEQAHPNIKIQRDAVPFSSLLSKADQEAASHTLPDVLELDNPDMANFAATGALTQLDSYMTGDLSSDSFYSGSLSTMQYQGKTYAFSVGSNDLALYYNKDLFSAANLTPPKTWAEFTQDAKTLTKGNTYGFAISAKADEEGTWQFEPFFWTNKASLNKVNSTQGVAALQLLTDMVKQGSLSKASLNWAQGDEATQFQEGHAAMMINGPWEIGLLNGKVNYGVVSIPVPDSSHSPVSPLGGEDWTLPANNSGHSQAAVDLVKWLEGADQLTSFDQVNGYIPPVKSVSQTYLQTNADLKVFADELNTAQARTATVGTKYPDISQQIWTAEQSALSGSMSPQAALDQAQQHIDSILNS